VKPWVILHIFIAVYMRKIQDVVVCFVVHGYDFLVNILKRL
jgi:hypothetical protein